MLCRVWDCLCVGCVCMCPAAASDCLLCLSPCCRSAPPLLYHSPSSGESRRPWCALIRTPTSVCAARALSSSSYRARAWIAVRVSESEWERLGFTEWVIPRNQMQLLPAFLTADYCSGHVLIKANTASNIPPTFVNSFPLVGAKMSGAFYYPFLPHYDQMVANGTGNLFGFHVIKLNKKWGTLPILLWLHQLDHYKQGLSVYLWLCYKYLMAYTCH